MKTHRIFHRIWLGSKPLPAEFAAFGETWAAHHPGWEMRLWTDANLPPLINQQAFDRAPTFAAEPESLVIPTCKNQLAETRTAYPLTALRG